MGPRICYAFVLLSGLLALSGCGAGSPGLAPVEGVIKINSMPADNLLIQFHPVNWPEGSPVLSASAVSDATGRFVLKCGNGLAGAPLGKHKVTVADNRLNVEEEHVPGKRTRLVNRVPIQYSAATTTPLDMVVEVSKKEYELNLVAPR